MLTAHPRDAITVRVLRLLRRAITAVVTLHEVAGYVRVRCVPPIHRDRSWRACYRAVGVHRAVVTKPQQVNECRRIIHHIRVAVKGLD
jgi:hypothetical protein